MSQNETVNNNAEEIDLNDINLANDEPAQKIFSLVEVESDVIEDISFFDDAIKY